MAIVYRTPGPWGPGLSENLSPAQVDNNFWQLVQDVASKAIQGVGISNFVVSGNQFTVVLTDHTLLGPYPLPIAQITFRHEWQPNTSYIANDIFTHGGSTYITLVNHISAATFDPGANDGLGHDFYGLLLQNAAITIPVGGFDGAFLRKLGSVDFAAQWQTAELSELSDVLISASPGPAEKDVLTFTHGVWENAAEPRLATLPDTSFGSISVGDVLTWTGSVWTNILPETALANLTDVAVTSPAVGNILLYNGVWVNSNVRDPIVTDLGSLSGSFNLDLSLVEILHFNLAANGTIMGFFWPVGSIGKFVRRVIQVSNTGAFTLTWPSFIKWPGGVKPVLTSGSGKIDVFILHTYDSGTTIFGSIAGQNYF
jgi:hypothetical protein